MSKIDLQEIQSLRKVTGIYLLYKEEELVYIGQSTNIYVRVLEHICDREKDFDSVYGISIIEERELLEVCLISRLKPKYNKLFVDSYKWFTKLLPMNIREIAINIDIGYSRHYEEIIKLGKFEDNNNLWQDKILIQPKLVCCYDSPWSFYYE